jgi:hypothetical protein
MYGLSTRHHSEDRQLRRGEVVIFSYEVDSSFWKHETHASIENLMEMLAKQSCWSWIRENNIKIDITSHNMVHTFTQFVSVTAEMSEQQKTFFLLKYGPIR